MAMQALIKLQYMRPYASCQVKKHELNSDVLPKVKNSIKDQQSPIRPSQNSSTELPSTIKGVVGQAISFYSFTNASTKIKPKHLFEITIKPIFDFNSLKKKQSADNETNNTVASAEKMNDTSDYVSSIRNSYKRSKYFAFERLVKMNSESYGAYNNWLKEKRKASPVFVKMGGLTKRIIDASENTNTLSSNEEHKQVKIDEQKQEYPNAEKALQKIFRKDVRLHTRQKSSHKSEYLEELFVTRTNLIRKIGTNLQSNAKKNTTIHYPGKNNKIYKFFLGPGNNHEIIKKVLEETRGSNWTQTTQYDTLFNLKWEQYSDKSIYQRLDFGRYRQLINHFQFHEFISTKGGLIETLKQHRARMGHNMDIFQFVPITFVFDWSDKTKFEEQLKRFVYCYCENHPDIERVQKMERDLVELSRYLWKGSKQPPNMSFDRNSIKRLNIPLLDAVFKQECSQYLWIIKPSEYNRGRGIKIFSTLEQLREIIKESMPTDSFVIQKYIERPLLTKNRKFDIRVWVLVTPESQSYFFEEGYIRTSSEIFSLNYNCNENQYIHLTNNAVQKNSNNYGIYQQGNQLSFNSMDPALMKQEGYFKKKFLPEIKRLCSLVIEAGVGKITGEEKIKHHLNSHYIKQTYRVKSKYNQPSTNQFPPNSEQKINLPTISSPLKVPMQQKITKKGSFEIFGFDFMIDREEKVWLIEVNTNPCLETSSKILEVLIPRMIDDAFKIVLDPIFKLSTKLECSAYKVEGYEDSQNMWTPLNKIFQI